MLLTARDAARDVAMPNKREDSNLDIFYDTSAITSPIYIGYIIITAVEFNDQKTTIKDHIQGYSESFRQI